MRKNRKGANTGKRRRVMITLPNDLWKKIRLMAVEEEIPASYLLEKAVELFLEKSNRHTRDTTQKAREDSEGSLF